jgi:dCTP deaminase
LIDIERRASCDVADFWEPMLDPGEFYILASKEAVQVLPYSAEMVPFDPLVGEFRVYHAGSSATPAPARIGQGRGQGRAKVAKSEYRDLGEFLRLQSFFFS